MQYVILVNGFFHGVMEGDGLHKVLSRCSKVSGKVSPARSMMAVSCKMAMLCDQT